MGDMQGTTVPASSRVVIIGGGVVGCSIAYQLAVRGVDGVTVVERRGLTDGSTWHAAGLVGQLRSSASLTQLMAKSVEIYDRLEQDTGLATGWRPVGSLRVASSPDRWREIRRLATAGKSFGFDVHLTSPAEAKELFPFLDIDGVHGATFVPSDGYIDPSQLTHAFAGGARAAGVRIVQHCRVEALERVGRRVTAVVTEQGRIECETVVNATGMWGAETARLAGVDVAVNAVEHQYVVTGKAAEIPADLPTLRDPDARFYLKPESGSLAFGGWEEGTRAPWRTVPRDFGPQLFEPNYDRFEPIHMGVSKRIPFAAELGIQSFINGPIPFSPDAEPLLGVTEDLDNLYHCCGFSAGVAAAGGAGWAVANWIADGDPGLDLWDFDVRRFGASHSVPTYLEERAVEAYGHYYSIAYPNRELSAPRGQRRSALYDVLSLRGAVLGTKFGWERANWFAPQGTHEAEEPTFGRSNAFQPVGAEHEAIRTSVAVIDQSSFSKYELSGPGAVELLAKLAGNRTDVAVGSVVYSQLLNERGGIEADVTITRLGTNLFYLVTGSGFGRHDVAFLLEHAPDDGTVVIRDVTSDFGVLNVCGPRSRDLLQALSRADLSRQSFAYMTARDVDIGYAPVRALRVTYVGELGYELHVPTEYVRGLYEQLIEAGSTFAIRDAGYRALNSLRLEKQYLAWALDMNAYTNPYEVGLGFAVKADRPELLAGPALRAISAQGPQRKLCWFTADADLAMHGGECLVHPPTGYLSPVRSAGYGYTVARTIFSAFLPIELAAGTAFSVEVAGEQFPAIRHDRPLYDPAADRVRS